LNNWRPGLQEEFIRIQGPYSTDLFDYLKKSQSCYDVIVFFTYLYAPTYFGMSLVDPERTFLVPTLHDEPPAYLSLYRSYVDRARQMIWLTEAEQRLGKRLWGTDKGAVVGIPVEIPSVEPAEDRPYPYLLYSGRIDLSKGCGILIDSFLAYKERCPSDLRLVLTGDKILQLEKHPDIIYEGRVDHETKYRLMKGALAFVMPSPYESFSIATLEAMGQGTPVIVNEKCEVLKDHVMNSGAGKCFLSEADFGEAIDWVREVDTSQRAELSAKAIQHVLDNYDLERVHSKLVAVLS
jgi:glycosyltransferase involved in cell wall biosynthesis